MILSDGDWMEGQRLGLVFGLVFLAGCASIVYLMSYSIYLGNTAFDLPTIGGHPMAILRFVGTDVFPDENGNDILIVLQIKNTGDFDLIIDNELQTITNLELHNHLLDNPPKHVFSDRTVNVGETATLYVSIPEYDSWHQTLEPISYWNDHPTLIKFRITCELAQNASISSLFSYKDCHTWVTMPY